MKKLITAAALLLSLLTASNVYAGSAQSAINTQVSINNMTYAEAKEVLDMWKAEQLQDVKHLARQLETSAPLSYNDRVRMFTKAVEAEYERTLALYE